MSEMWVCMELTVISTFAGCGGSSLGYKMAGFKELLAIEWEDNAVETFKLNFPEIPIWQKDIKEIKSNDILKFCNIEKGKLDVFDGSPPCQGFSTAGKRELKDERNDLFKEYVRLLKGLKPKVFVMENVSGMAKGKMKGKFIEILKELKSAGYNVKCKQMNAKYYNVAQSRERLIFIGTRKDLRIEPSFPIANKKIITVRTAIKGCKCGLKQDNFIGERLELSKKIKPYKAGNDITKGMSFNLKRLSFDKPSRTVIKQIGNNKGVYGGGLIHPTENRHLTINELKRISSFPDNFKLIGTFQEQWARIGNAVMPNMMKAIAEHIRDNILNGKPYKLTIK